MSAQPHIPREDTRQTQWNFLRRPRFLCFFACAASVPSAGAQYASHPAAYTGGSNHRPIALHQLVVVPPGGEALIPLRGYDLDGNPLKATVKALPAGDAGSLFQLSKVRAKYLDPPRNTRSTVPLHQPLLA